MTDRSAIVRHSPRHRGPRTRTLVESPRFLRSSADQTEISFPGWSRAPLPSASSRNETQDSIGPNRRPRCRTVWMRWVRITGQRKRPAGGTTLIERRQNGSSAWASPKKPKNSKNPQPKQRKRRLHYDGRGEYQGSDCG